MVTLLSMKHKHDGSKDFMHSLSIAKVRVHLAVDEQQIQHGFPKRGGRGRGGEGERRRGRVGGEGGGGGKRMGERRRGRGEWRREDDGREGRKEKQNVLGAHTRLSLPHPPPLRPPPPLPPPSPPSPPSPSSLDMCLFEEGHVRKGTHHILIDHLPKLIVQKEPVPGALPSNSACPNKEGATRACFI